MGDSKNSSTSRTGAAQNWAQPHAMKAIDEAESVYAASQPGLNQINSQVQGIIPGIIAKYNAGNSALTGATGYASDVLGGQYLDQGNPHLQSIIDRTNADVADTVGARFGTRGAFASSGYVSELSKQLANNETNLRYGDYSSERDRMGQAMSSAPQLAAAEYLGVSPVIAASQAAANLPYAGISQLSQNLATLWDGGRNKQVQKSGLGDSLLGAASAGLGAFAAGGGFK